MSSIAWSLIYINMAKRTYVTVSLQVEGFHFWRGAPAVVDFLCHRHRHIFHIKAVKEVKHDDRDVEFILFKREIEAYLITEYAHPKGAVMDSSCEFGGMSCEMIATELVDEFGLHSCSVMEDGENGALVLND